MKLSFWKKSDKQKIINAPKASHGMSIPMIYKALAGLVVLGLLINFVLLYLLNNKLASANEEKAVFSETINRAASIMDKNSGTSYSNNLTPESLTDKDTYQQSLSLLTKQSANLVKERDSLAKSLSFISEIIDSKAIQNESALADLNTYEKSSSTVIEMCRKVLNANKELVGFLAEQAEKLQIPVKDKNELLASSKTSLDQNFLKSISDGVSNSVQQVTSLKSEISQKDAKITELNNSLKTGASGANDEFKKLFNDQRRQLDQLRREYEALKSKTLQSDIEEDAELQDLKEASAPEDKPIVVRRTSYPEFYYKLTGNVVDYNSKWGFVIIDIGSESKLNLEIDGEKRDVTVPAPVGQEIYISRGDRFIAKAKIVNVYGKYSVANVIFPANDQITKGDSIFFDAPSTPEIKNTKI